MYRYLIILLASLALPHIAVAESPIRGELRRLFVDMANADSISTVFMVDSIYAQARASGKLDDVDLEIETMLYDYWSDDFDERLFEFFIDGRMRGSMFSEVSKARAGYIKEILNRNKPGSIAADFCVIMRDGNESSLHKMISSIENDDKEDWKKNEVVTDCCPTAQSNVLLMFYDPDCDDCREAKAQLLTNPEFSNLKVIAIYSGEDVSLYESTLPEMPRNWLVGRAIESVEEAGLYDFMTMPTLYLLDFNGRVVLRNAKLKEILRIV